MRALLTCVLLTFSLTSLADTYEELYETAGWTEQRANFADALTAAQQRYKDTLPPAVFQALVTNSNRRFASDAIDQRAQQALRTHLPEPQPALEFFQSTLGRKIVSAEVLAARREQLARHANGLPQIEAGSNRQLLIRHLAQALPASEAGAEVSLALAGVAADSLSQMIPGLLGGSQAQSLLGSQRQRMMEQIEANLDNTLLYVYRELSDAELEEYLQFARSQAGQAYYQAALQALRAGLAVGMSGTDLEPQQGT
ncbi:hypothetical protein GFL09_20035 [Pseudomonas stutzeri]|uniref:DUF2059 domain-containing protein n=1 Tax=Stutzerimonas stutzeri KOS6 TaxID=1218352 RepID=A0A061JRS4_STUST|nr:hypothetical protein [Stutzerimonas stutzeri]EWC42397.1 hypothetical protein B597_005260 [Stutzerimonas stutzeri KOS6]MBK3869940.1 hypothetical protein [Stutzerimonas stutzeri]